MMQSNAARRLVPVAERPKVILPYERVSAVMGRDDEAFRSPDLQRRANLASIAAAGAIVYAPAIETPELFRDIDRTGRDFNREGIQRALELKRQGVIDGIAVLDVSRVGRTTSETLSVIDEFRDGDRGMFISDREHIDDTPLGELVLTVMVALAQLYSDNIALGWRAVIEDRHRDGHHNGQPPIGYDFARHEDGSVIKPSRIVIDERTAPYVREAFARYDEGQSASSITRWLRDAGIYRGSSLRNVLANPFYLGDVRLRVYSGKAKARKLVKDAPPLVVQGKGRHEPLLVDKQGRADRALFERVAQRLDEQAFTPRRFVEPIHALGGLAVCANCGRALVITKNRDTRFLNDRNGRVRGCVGAGACQPGALEEFVLGEVRTLLDGFEVGMGAQVAAQASRAGLLAEAKRLEAAIAKTERTITDMDADFYEGLLSHERHARLTARKDDQLRQLREQLAAIEVNDVPEVPDFIEAARALLSAWAEATPAERNRMLRACGVRKVRVREAHSYREPVAQRAEVVFAL